MKFIYSALIVIGFCVLIFFGSTRDNSNLSQTPYYEVESIYPEFNGNCLIYSDEQVIFRNEAELLKFSDEITSLFGISIACEGKTYSYIDFSKYSLVGIYTRASGCSRTVTKELYRDNQAQNIMYSVKVQQIGSCEPLVQSMNFVLIDAVPSSYDFEATQIIMK